MYDRINREALWQVFRLHDVGGKLLTGIKSMYVDSLPCARVRVGEVSSSGSIVYMGAVMKEVKLGWEGGE